MNRGVPMTTVTIHDAMFAPTTVESVTAAKTSNSAPARRRFDAAFVTGLVVGTTFWIGGPVALWAMASLVG